MSGGRRTLVKVCGLTRREDAEHAMACGADWLGFVVKGESPRRIEAERAGEIVASLAGRVVGVAVMVAPTPDEALVLARRANAVRVQIHGADAGAWPDDFPLPAAFAVPVGEDGRVLGPLPPEPHLVLMDTSVAGRTGGTGRPFPWSVARDVAATRAVMLAGGLGPDNVAEAVRQARPAGVDASSRLESSPGCKDPERVRRFVAAVREIDERHPD